MPRRPRRFLLLLVATSLLDAACSAGGPTGSVAPSSVVISTPSPSPSIALGSPAAAEAPVPVCDDRKPPWVEAAKSAKDGPDPAGRILFGQVDKMDDLLGQVVSPLFAVDPDGSDLEQILSCQVERPRISHDGTRLAFSIAMDDGTWQVATSAIDGTDLRILTATDGWAEMPDWAPDDSWLSYVLRERCTPTPDCFDPPTGHSLISRVNVDGSDARVIGNPDAFDSEARLSPDGGAVVFDRWDASKQTNLFMIRDLATGAERRVTTTNDGDIEHPDWTRDGRSIVYNTINHDLELIQTVPANDPGTAPTTLYGDATHTGFKPAYSPDGSRIVFGCDGNLCLMNADGSKVVTLVGPVGFELNHFAWGATP